MAGLVALAREQAGLRDWAQWKRVITYSGGRQHKWKKKVGSRRESAVLVG